jgi:hypothetical protein
MHCPRCGEQQVSPETKFCKRCGFQLGIVSELLLHGGFLPQLAELNQGKKKTIFTRRNGLGFSLMWFMFFMIMAMLWGGVADIEELGAACAVIGIFGGLMLMVASMIFLRKPPPEYPFAAGMPAAVIPAQFYAPVERGSLPPTQAQPAATYMPPEGSWRGPDTGELAHPGSVTETTTKLLKKDRGRDS